MKALAPAPLILSAAPILLAQEITIQKPPTTTRATVTNQEPGSGEELPLATIANDIGTLEGKHVSARGVLERVDVPSDDIKEYYVLRWGAARVLFVPGYGMFRDDLERLSGSEVLARGIVRMLKARLVRDQTVDLDTTYPELPPLPTAGPELPRVSLTVLSMSSSFGSLESPNARTRAWQILESPKLFKGRVVRIVGQFRGRNLFGDLPEGSERTPSDWVLLDAGQPLWVTKKGPTGAGFALDPAHKGDARHWLEVEGTAEVWNGLVYLRASKVMLALSGNTDRR